MGSLYTPSPALAARLVRDQVMQQTLGELPAPSLRQKLAASHYELSSTVSPLAVAAYQRKR
ncbi:hypothetical protein EFV37_22030 [Mesorhizobium loti]|uniref:Uncharacterized protein n=1 Tax=Mesorhizobium jarvisii TaxID=1777867 RepID=A0A6M7TKA5_9HYPH|nr:MULTISPECIES: hypothetical protein [Mesorhizobium]OBQ59597.1 hypothetical protein A9K72_25640 [Mesorhizobium loti]QKC64666.1 hypothetical protein EB229_22025 [Mesorhizobium jarvisii]QKD10580.1 hypothetical protein EFV37_22030 [Mesorhizobium loti]RJT30570.1 hypothetical protein D3242_24660 [Mesorhizobium jarvisii]